MYAASLNFVIATIWLLLSGKPSVPTFILGFIAGFLGIAAFRSLLPGGPAYVRRSLAFLRFTILFAQEFLLANFSVAATVLLRSRDALHPNFITYDIRDLRPGEILLLTYCITLTPGTMSIRVTDDFSSLIIHALDAEEPDRIRQSIDLRIRKPMLAFTR